MEKNMLVPVPVLQVIVNYLQTRPWNEVNAMILQVMQLKVEEPADHVCSDCGQ